MTPTNDNEPRGNQPVLDGIAAPLTPEELERKWGTRTPELLRRYNASRPPITDLIQDLISDQGITVSIGASHVGKSPFWGQACIAVAAGLGACMSRACHSAPGTRVLYLDCETTPALLSPCSRR